MRKVILGALAIGLLTAICWAGGDPWKDKPYAQWDDKDIQKVISSSPWARSVTVAAGWTPGVPAGGMGGGYGGSQPQQSSGQQTPAPASGGGGGMKGGGGGGGNSGGPQGGSPPGGGMDMPDIQQATFSVYWMSSRTMRAALGRRQVLHNGKSEADVDQMVDQPLDQYEVLIQGRDMTPFQNNDEAFFQSHTTLEMKKSKDKVSPSKVTFERGTDGKSVTAAFFFFPKRSSSGEGTIAADEKDLTFSCSLGKTTLRTDFDPRKMSDQKGPDL